MTQTLELTIKGMCCADEAEAVQRAIRGLPGVLSVEVLLAAEKARIVLEPDLNRYDKHRQRCREHRLHGRQR